MKSKIHVFSRLFTKKFTELAKVNLLLFVLFTVFAVPSARAVTISNSGAKVNVPCTGTTTVYVSSGVEYFYVYDDGGETANYSNSCNGVLSIQGAQSLRGKAFKVETDDFVQIENGHEILRIANSSQFSMYNGYYLEQMYETSSLGTFGPLYTTGVDMAVQFVTDAATVRSGFALKVNIVDRYDLSVDNITYGSNGSIHVWAPYPTDRTLGYIDNNSIASGSKVSLYDLPNSDFFLSSLKVKDKSGNLLNITESKDNSGRGYDSLQFTMPSGYVSVSPTYTSLKSLSSVDMLCRTATLNIPSNISSFNIYDNGGSSESYTNNCNAYLTLKAPAGYRIKLTGTMSTEAPGGFDYLKIYDGANTSGSLLATKQSSTDGVALDIGTINSTGQNMTLWFHSDNFKTYSGLNLTASLVVPSFAISMADYSNGSVSVVSSANPGSTVTITATPNTNCLLKSLTVATTSGTNISLTKGSGNTWTFTMPSENVKVTPVFMEIVDYTITYNNIDAGGRVSGVTSAKAGNTVTVTATPLNSSYLLKDVKVISPGNIAEVVSLKWFNNSATFTMPFNNVTVTPSFTNNLTAAGGLYINMPTTGTSKVTIPNGVKSFKVYDDGGKSGSYSKSSNGTLVLTAPAGYVLELAGKVKTGYTNYDYTYGTYTCNSGDNLSVYNGSSTSASALLSGRTGCNTTNGPIESTITKIYSTGRYMTLNFKSDGKSSSVSDGIDLTVTVHKLAMDLADDGNGNKYVNMIPKNKSTLSIPEGVTSFKVYDDGGKSENYLKNSNDTLVLTAPEGHVLQLTGTVVTGYIDYTNREYTCNKNDNLSVYDGASTSATTLLSGQTGCHTTYGSSATTIRKTLTTGRNLTLYFKSDASGYSASGLNLTVTVHKLDMNLADDGNGNKFVNMIPKNTATLAIPAGVTSFKVYDDGGKFGNYLNNSSSTLVLKAPEGHILLLTGSVKTGYTKYTSGASEPYTCNANDNLSIYDGSNTSATALVLGKIGCTASSGPWNSSLPVIISGGRYLTLNFKSDGNSMQVSDGIDLTVTVHKLDMNLAADGNGNKYVNMIPKHKATLAIPEGEPLFYVYDDGGVSGNYLKNSNDTLVLTAPSGHVLQLTGTVMTGYAEYIYGAYTCNANDNLSVYDGNNTSAMALLSGKTSDCTTADGPKQTSLTRLQSSGQSMTLVFKSNGIGYSSNGLYLMVNVVPIVNQITYKHTNEGGYVSSSAPQTANIGATVNYTYSFSSGYLVSDIKVTAKNGDVVKVSGGWFNGANISFKMPPSNVTVTSTYTNNLTADGGLYIDMPATGMVTATIPEGVKSFKVYDDGGQSGVYSRNSNGSLVLTAPEGYVLQLKGTLMTGYTEHLFDSYTCNAKDNLSVYDGASTSATPLLFEKTSDCTTDNGPKQMSLTSLQSSGRSMTLVFKSNASGFSLAGLDLTIFVRKAKMELALDDNGKKYVNMIPDFNAELPISKDDDSFMVYDDGGKNGYYSKNSNSTLVLTAPDGYLLQVMSGVIKTGSVLNEHFVSEYGQYFCNSGDNLSVYDGNSTSATPLLLEKTSECTADHGPRETFVSTGRSSGPSMTLVFKSNDYGESSDGFYLNVKLIKPLADMIIADVESQTYTGSEICPDVVVKDGKAVLVKNTDYTVTCSDNINVGTATVAISGIGDYTGTVSKPFTIIPKIVKCFAAVTIEKDENGTFAVIDGNYSGTDAVEIENEVEDVPVVYNRSFPANAYSTILLPFDVNTANIEGPDAVLRYNGIKDNSSIRMKVVWAKEKWVKANNITDAKGDYKQYPDVNLNANTPYLVQMGDATSEDGKTVALKVNGTVTIKKTTDPDVTLDKWTFRGTWEYKKWAANDDELGYAYGFAASASETNNIKVGDFVKVGAGAWIRPMRAYLVKAELPKKAAQLARANGAYVMRPTVVPEELPELMSIVIDGDDDNEEHTTVIGHFNTRTGEIKMNYDRGKFDLKGRRVNGEKPNARGAYYGKKAK